MEREETTKRRTYPGWLVDIVERADLTAKEIEELIKLYEEVEDRPTNESVRQLQLQNQLLQSYYSERLDLLEKTLAAYKEGNLKRANRIEKRYNAMRPKASKQLSQWLLGHPVFSRTRLEDVLLHMERKDLGQEVSPSYDNCLELAKMLGIPTDKKVPVFFIPDMDHFSQALKMSKLQIGKYLRGLVSTGVITTVKRGPKPMVYLTGDWSIYNDPEGQRKTKRIYAWKTSDKARRKDILKRLNQFYLGVKLKKP